MGRGSSGLDHELDQVERELADADAARPRNVAVSAAALERAVAALRRWPEVAEVFEPSDLYGDLTDAYEELGRYEDALAAMGSAIEAGYRSEPDPRCRLAELHLRFGHPELAHPIFAEVKVETPDDVWLYNNAGLEYGHSGDPLRALPWLEEGLELAMRTGDPERLVGQLSDLRHQCLDALGRPVDDLQDRAAAFEPTAQRRALVAATPQTAWPSGVAQTERPADRGGVAMAMAWFPAGELPLALERWPDLVEGWGVSDFGGYCRATQLRMLRYAKDPAGHQLTIKVAPVVLSTYLPWCEERGEEPGAGPARAAYAADRLRTGAADVISWPPARNERCWCGSGRKYKQCCGTVRLTPDQP